MSGTFGRFIFSIRGQKLITIKKETFFSQPDQAPDLLHVTVPRL